MTYVKFSQIYLEKEYVQRRCKNNHIVCQILMEEGPKHILNVFRASKLKSAVRRISINQETFLIDAIKLYKDPTTTVTTPIEVAFEGNYNHNVCT